MAAAPWAPQPDLKTATAAWILAEGRRPVSARSHRLQPGDRHGMPARDAEMAGIEFLVIDKNSNVADFKKELRWNELYYALAR